LVVVLSVVDCDELMKKEDGDDDGGADAIL
jgi:hypothetical protein